MIKLRFLSMAFCLLLFAAVKCAAAQGLTQIDLIEDPLVIATDGDEWCHPSNLTEVLSFPAIEGISASDFPVKCEVASKITAEGKGTIQSVKCSDDRFKQNTIDAFNKVIWKSERSGLLCRTSDQKMIYPVIYNIE